MSHRRDFLKTLGGAALAAGVAPGLARAATGRVLPAGGAAPGVDAYLADLTQDALQAATENGASYADVRIGRYRRQAVNTRERQVTGVSDSESYGVGVRALVAGAWGFAGTQDVTRDGVRKAALEATRAARAAKRVQRRPVELAPVTAVKGAWKTPVTTDPFDVPIEDKVALLLAANEAALKVKNVRFATSGVAALREEKTLGTTDGTLVTQTFYRIAPSFTATAIGNGDFQAYTEELAPRGSGWEYMLQLDMPTNGEKWAALAAEKLTARERALAQGVVVVVGSRAGAGSVPVGTGVRRRAGQPDAPGTVGTGDLNVQKARVLLMLALTRAQEPREIARLFAAHQ